MEDFYVEKDHPIKNIFETEVLVVFNLCMCLNWVNNVKCIHMY